VIGSAGPTRYVRRLQQLADRHRAWLHLHVDVTRDGLLHHIAQHRYAIHGMREEHFGIAPAEAAAGGCIVFVPDGGGQVDIAGDEPRLRYGSDADAVAKIVAVLRSPGEQDRLQAHLAARRSLFSRETFMEAVRGLVHEVASRRPDASGPWRLDDRGGRPAL
jgi:glycosyltransferase involved in cell wall biosynthesis